MITNYHIPFLSSCPRRYNSPPSPPPPLPPPHTRTPPLVHDHPCMTSEDYYIAEAMEFQKKLRAFGNGGVDPYYASEDLSDWKTALYGTRYVILVLQSSKSPKSRIAFKQAPSKCVSEKNINNEICMKI